MFSDTHFHFKMTTGERGADGVEILSAMARRKCFFGLDIGTHCDDLAERQACVEKALAGISEPALAERARAFMYFTAGTSSWTNSMLPADRAASGFSCPTSPLRWCFYSPRIWSLLPTSISG